jgi:prolipoprotein diacylglyceryltransferase
MYVAFSGLERLLIEQIRVNVPYTISGFEFTQAELISVLMIITGIAGIFILLKRNKTTSSNAGNGHI